MILLKPTAARRRDLALVGAFTVLASIPFLSIAFGMDDAFFLAIARHLLRDPLHPLGFSYNWFGRTQPMAELNAYPPILPYFLAVGLKLADGTPWLLRVTLWPFDLLAAWALYLITARFLARPLWPTLIVLAGPAYWINMQHPLSEKLMAAFGFWGLYTFLRGADERRAAWLAGSSCLVACAIAVKFSAVFLLFPCVAYGLRRGLPWPRLAAWACLALAPAAGYCLYSLLSDRGMLQLVAKLVLQRGGYHARAPWPKQLRSTLSFIGGCGVVTAVWPYPLLAAAGRRKKAGAALLAAAVVVLFLPWLDSEPIRWADRALGVFFSAGAALSLLECWPPGAAGAFLGAWACSVAALQCFVYWSIVSRYVLFMMPPLIIALAMRLESRGKAGPPLRLYASSFAATTLLSLALCLVEARYENAQRDVASLVDARYIARGKRVWFVGHWGLQHYMEEVGGRALDYSQGGWAQTLPGDVVVIPHMNSETSAPPRPVRADVSQILVDCPVPLRLMSHWKGQAGFYSNVWGFLPYCVSDEPLEEFHIVELR